MMGESKYYLQMMKYAKNRCTYITTHAPYQKKNCTMKRKY